MAKPRLSPGDKGLISILLLGSFCYILYQWVLWPQPSAKMAEIRVNGQLIQTLPLRAGYTQEVRIGDQIEYAVIETNDGKVRIRQDDSSRQIGVQTGWISQPPQQIINLPYRIVVTVVSAAAPEIDAIVR
jgi:hypothetical protein